ncbi:MAG: ribonuclease III [Coriobacteriales bacterium]|jgi:ribonuclease-3|nr:ribonuclease III [Coriobacteriales bacterium]
MELTSTECAERVRRVEEILGYSFTDKNLLIQAITHPSAAEDNPIAQSYERLEFLGDSLLGAIIAIEIYERFPQIDEGGLTRIKVALVSGGMLAERADELGLSELIIFGSSERGTGKRGLTSALENVFEALVAAITLDGGLTAASKWVVSVMDGYIDLQLAAEPENPKSILQEMLQERRITPTYELVETVGPPHDRCFTANVLSEGRVIGTGSGHSKKDAETQAAAAALQQLRRFRPKSRKKSAKQSVVAAEIAEIP